MDHQGICKDLSASCVWHTTTEEVGCGSQGDPDPEAHREVIEQIADHIKCNKVTKEQVKVLRDSLVSKES